jgi:outer membrane protein assembly factor BamA
MKKTFTLLLILVFALSVYGQEKKVKTGWKFGGALPAVTVSSDLGFQYGALVEFFNYGDGSKYPDFLDHTYTEISRYTKGSATYRMMFESKRIIPGIYWISDLSYLPDRANQFYGYNGYESVFNNNWMKDEGDGQYRTRMFYRMQRNQFRFKNDFEGKLSGEHLKWNAGFAFQNFKVSSVDIDKLNKGKSTDLLPSVASEPGLYERYQNLGLITPNEADGGWVNTVKAGISWDSRDNRPNPMKGIWTEMGVEISPKFLGNDWGFSRLYITHRQYFTLVKDDLALVYRVGYQTKLTGSVPFFYLSQVITSRLTGTQSEGLGGSSTMRGVLLNRVIGDGFVYGNVELRWKPIYFKLFKQDCYLGLDAFYDFGVVTDKIDLPSTLSATFTSKYPEEPYNKYFNIGQEKLHQSAGISIMPVINQNFVIAFDIGKAFNAQDGNIGFSIGLNYLF